MYSVHAELSLYEDGTTLLLSSKFTFTSSTSLEYIALYSVAYIRLVFLLVISVFLLSADCIYFGRKDQSSIWEDISFFIVRFLLAYFLIIIRRMVRPKIMKKISIAMAITAKKYPCEIITSCIKTSFILSVPINTGIRCWEVL